MTNTETHAAPRNTEEQLVGDLLTVDGKGREAKRKALCRLLGLMDPFRREELIIYAERYHANAPLERTAVAGTLRGVVGFPRVVAALVDMVTQHCRSEQRGEPGKPCFLAYTHDFVSANEIALHVLEDCGEMERLPETAEWWRVHR